MQTLFQLTQKEYDALCKKYFPFAEHEKKLNECYEMIKKLQQEIDEIKACIKARDVSPAGHPHTPVMRVSSRHNKTSVKQQDTQSDAAPSETMYENDLAVDIRDGGAVITKYTGMQKFKIIIPQRIRDHEVTAIGDDVFRNQRNLRIIVLPDSLREIGRNAFRGCTALNTVRFPDSLTKIGACAFESCLYLKSIDIPESVKEIGENAFKGCTALTDVTLPYGITVIPEGLFKNCTALENIVIPYDTTRISDEAFGYCTSLKEINIPKTVTSIGENAFCDCSALSELTVPSGVTEIGFGAFARCTSLTRITIRGIGTEIGFGAFDQCRDLTIYAPAESYAADFAVKNNIVLHII